MSMPKGTIIKSDEEKHKNSFRVYLTNDELEKFYDVANFYEMRNGVMMRMIFNNFYEDFRNMSDLERLRLRLRLSLGE